MSKEKKDSSVISIALSPEIIKKLDLGKYNKSKLIDGLLDKYFDEEEKKVKKDDK